MSIQNLVKVCPLVLKILSGNQSRMELELMIFFFFFFFFFFFWGGGQVGGGGGGHRVDVNKELKFL